ncbi:dethiobiotin synthase [Luteimonas arsenica]|uniref:dethiobiotin synthase n=1 Tax=Luteimonas arsenica TaxID=1586242 RepID=UPI001055EB74|nr:dethiobiotin synthase [Luteimonas arsenica]
MAATTFFITGTDTGIGKTLASTALLHALRAQGRRASGMKPVAAGCEPGDGGWRNADALALQAASRPRPPYADVNPYPLPEPTAPQLAARIAGIRVSPGVLAAAHARIAANCDVVVVEGAGGWMAPLADGLEHALLARSLDADVVLVVGLRLGCLNHARLSARAIEDDGLRLAGWIGSTLEPDFSADYLALVEDALPAPCLGVLPYLPEGDARAAAKALRLPAGD